MTTDITCTHISSFTELIKNSAFDVLHRVKRYGIQPRVAKVLWLYINLIQSPSILHHYIYIYFTNDIITTFSLSLSLSLSPYLFLFSLSLTLNTSPSLPLPHFLSPSLPLFLTPSLPLFECAVKTVFLLFWNILYIDISNFKVWI